MTKQSKEEKARLRMIKAVEGGKLTPLKAIRWHCLDCVCYSPDEVRLCGNVECPLHKFRFGKNPSRAKKVNANDEGN